MSHVSLNVWRKFLTETSITIALASAHITSAQNQPEAFDHSDHLKMLSELETAARGLLAQVVSQRDDLFKTLCNLGEGVSDDG